jgi:hypothetical protein
MSEKERYLKTKERVLIDTLENSVKYAKHLNKNQLSETKPAKV